MSDSLLPDALVESATRVIVANRAAGRRVAVAESCTGGLVAAALTEVAGSSDVLEAAIVSYANDAKMGLLHVSSDVLETFGAVSIATAWSMAQGALEVTGADVAVAITGIAGPGGSEFKPEGRVCFGLAREGAETQVETVEFGALGRDKVREAARDHALALLLSAAQG